MRVRANALGQDARALHIFCFCRAARGDRGVGHTLISPGQCSSVSHPLALKILRKTRIKTAFSRTDATIVVRKPHSLRTTTRSTIGPIRPEIWIGGAPTTRYKSKRATPANATNHHRYNIHDASADQQHVPESPFDSLKPHQPSAP